MFSLLTRALGPTLARERWRRHAVPEPGEVRVEDEREVTCGPRGGPVEVDLAFAGAWTEVPFRFDDISRIRVAWRTHVCRFACLAVGSTGVPTEDQTELRRRDERVQQMIERLTGFESLGAFTALLLGWPASQDDPEHRVDNPCAIRRQYRRGGGPRRIR
jgi:hypothetical protein